jgi:glycine oxidase
MHVVVIGAGVVGASVAQELARQKADVTLLDMRAPGRGASRASAGILAPYTEATPGSPLFELCVRSLAMYDSFITHLAAKSQRPIEYERRGTIEVAVNDAQAEKLRAEADRLLAQQVTCEWLDAAQVRELEPTMSAGVIGGLLVTSQGFVGVTSLVDALVQSAWLMGASCESAVEAVRVDPQHDRVEVRTKDRRYVADYVVMACGSWTSRVTVRGATPVPVRPIRGQLLELKWADNGSAPRHVLWGPDCYTVPWPDGTLLVGATVEDVGFDERSTVEGVEGLTRAVSELLPASRLASVQSVRVGLRPATPDGLPAIGPLPGAPRVIVATGHYRNGVLLAPITADLVARDLLRADRDPLLASVNPARFSS